MDRKKLIEISPSTPVKNNPMRRQVVAVVDDSPLNYILCLKKEDMKHIEKTGDCFILDFDASDSIDIAKLSVNDDNRDADLSVVAEKGQVACRDYPHPRHLCLRFAFDATPHKRHCHLCHCYVCDSTAPCKHWKSHSHASDHVGDWKLKRKLRREFTGYRTT